ncbi:MAG: LPS export ABC transporter periplasmic protein LptC [Bacteroidetes bacterium]|nr:MAG: LPS export ABC transporter periplasmic protein LptC [Bacteroidota bacterium]
MKFNISFAQKLISQKMYWFIFAFILLFFSSCEEEQITKKQENKPKNDSTLIYKGPNVMFWNVQTLYSEDAKLKIKLKSAEQLVQQNGDVQYPKGVDIGVYNDLGVKTTTLRADSAYYLKATSTYRAVGQVVVVNLQQKQTLYTEELNWDQNQHVIFTEKNIKIVTVQEILYGIGLKSNEDFSNYTIKKPTGIFAVKE